MRLLKIFRKHDAEKLKIFNEKVTATRKQIVFYKVELGKTFGLCQHIENLLGEDARLYFEKEFKGVSPFPKELFWLGDRSSEEGYIRRLGFLELFRDKAIEDKEYLKWIK